MTSPDLPPFEEYLDAILAGAKRYYERQMALCQERREPARPRQINPRALDQKKGNSSDSRSPCVDCGKPCGSLRCAACHRKWREWRDHHNEK